MHFQLFSLISLALISISSGALVGDRAKSSSGTLIKRAINPFGGLPLAVVDPNNSGLGAKLSPPVSCSEILCPVYPNSESYCLAGKCAARCDLGFVYSTAAALCLQ